LNVFENNKVYLKKNEGTFFSFSFFSLKGSTCKDCSSSAAFFVMHERVEETGQVELLLAGASQTHGQLTLIDRQNRRDGFRKLIKFQLTSDNRKKKNLAKLTASYFGAIARTS
jgi:hypothetical protein